MYIDCSVIRYLVASLGLVIPRTWGHRELKGRQTHVIAYDFTPDVA